MESGSSLKRGKAGNFLSYSFEGKKKKRKTKLLVADKCPQLNGGTPALFVLWKKFKIKNKKEWRVLAAEQFLPLKPWQGKDVLAAIHPPLKGHGQEIPYQVLFWFVRELPAFSGTASKREGGKYMP